MNLYHTVHSRIQGTTEGLVVSTEHTPQVGAAVAGTEASEVTCMNLCDHFFLSNKAFAGRKQNKTNRSSYLVPGLMPMTSYVHIDMLVLMFTRGPKITKCIDF